MVRTTIAASVMLRTVADSIIILILGYCFSYNVTEFYKNLPKFLICSVNSVVLVVFLSGNYDAIDWLKLEFSLVDWGCGMFPSHILVTT